MSSAASLRQLIPRRGAVVAGLAALIALGVATCAPSVVLIAADSFDTDLRNGWGSTESGGLYTLSGERSDFDVSDGVGKIFLSQPALREGRTWTSFPCGTTARRSA